MVGISISWGRIPCPFDFLEKIWYTGCNFGESEDHAMAPRICLRCGRSRGLKRIKVLEKEGVTISVLPKSKLCLDCTARKVRSIMRAYPGFIREGLVNWGVLGKEFTHPEQREDICSLLLMAGFLSGSMNGHWLAWKDGKPVAHFIDDSGCLLCLTDKATAVSFLEWVGAGDGFDHWLAVCEATSGMPASGFAAAAA